MSFCLDLSFPIRAPAPKEGALPTVAPVFTESGSPEARRRFALNVGFVGTTGRADAGDSCAAANAFSLALAVNEASKDRPLRPCEDSSESSSAMLRPPTPCCVLPTKPTPPRTSSPVVEERNHRAHMVSRVQYGSWPVFYELLLRNQTDSWAKGELASQTNLPLLLPSSRRAR